MLKTMNTSFIMCKSILIQYGRKLMFRYLIVSKCGRKLKICFCSLNFSLVSSNMGKLESTTTFSRSTVKNPNSFQNRQMFQLSKCKKGPLRNRNFKNTDRACFLKNFNIVTHRHWVLCNLYFQQLPMVIKLEILKQLYLSSHAILFIQNNVEM